ncbi:aliphatic sulfonate ABC transporter ATP-binding protein, partial [Cupriavidus sp. HPC(L)]|uniref:ATP-binding cassette domain-containing protein n=1 Tax=Cupriavidus sp. HPC(L) TaxID=1217418 RepID=UPI0003BE8996
MHATQQHLPLRRAGREASESDPPAAPRTADDRGDRTPRPRGTEVAISAVHKAYGGRTVLQQIDLRIAPGEFVAIVGRSGCGKSTLLRLVAGLEGPSAGRIALDGRPQDGHDHGTRIMFQDARLLPWKRVLDNIALGLPGREGRERAREALAQVGLAERADDWPAVL